MALEPSTEVADSAEAEPAATPETLITSERQDPGIELLVTLAKSGEIDPWDVDIIVVTDKYLAALDQMETRSLQACGKGLFYACVLLHLKAQILAAQYRPPEPEVDFGDVGDDYGDDMGDPADLEWAEVVSSGNGVLLVPRGRPRQRPITLDDLIRALQRCDTAEKTRRDSGLPPTSFFVDSTIQDDIAGDIERVRGLLARVGEMGPSIPFKKLLGGDISASGLFLALLFMAARNEVDLAQEHFYRDLSILRGEQQ